MGSRRSGEASVPPRNLDMKFLAFHHIGSEVWGWRNSFFCVLTILQVIPLLLILLQFENYWPQSTREGLVKEDKECLCLAVLKDSLCNFVFMFVLEMSKVKFRG